MFLLVENKIFTGVAFLIPKMSVSLAASVITATMNYDFLACFDACHSVKPNRLEYFQIVQFFKAVQQTDVYCFT